VKGKEVKMIHIQPTYTTIRELQFTSQTSSSEVEGSQQKGAKGTMSL
jgi:hypothetical protein